MNPHLRVFWVEDAVLDAEIEESVEVVMDVEVPVAA
mgnify:CR=1 FL=1